MVGTTWGILCTCDSTEHSGSVYGDVLDSDNGNVSDTDNDVVNGNGNEAGEHERRDYALCSPSLKGDTHDI